MKLTDFSFRHRVFVFVMFFVATAYGAYLFFTMPQREYPPLDLRMAEIVVHAPGMDVQQIQQWVAKPLERKVSALATVDFVVSQARQGLLTMHVQGHHGKIKDVDAWLQLIQHQMRSVTLPQGVSQPQLRYHQLYDLASFTLAFTYPDGQPHPVNAQLDKLRQQLRIAFPTLKNIGIYGQPQLHIQVEPDPAKLARYHMSVLQLKQLLHAANATEMGGYLKTGSKDLLVLPKIGLKTVEDVKNILIRLPNQHDHVPLSTVASVTEHVQSPPEESVVYDGKPAMLLALYFPSGTHLKTQAAAIGQFVSAQNQQLPVGFHLAIDSNEALLVDHAMTEMNWNLVVSVVVVALSVMIMLTWRSGLLVASMIPISVFLTMIVFEVLGRPLNRIAYGAIILALGLLVDNAMVIVEEARHLIDQGVARLAAAKESANKYAGPLLVSQATTILAFLPALFSKEQAGEAMHDLPIIVMCLLLFSWFAAQTLLPLLCAHFMKPRAVSLHRSEDELLSGPQYRLLKTVLAWALDRRLLTLLVTVLIFLSSLWAFSNVPKAFIPPTPSRQLLVTMTWPNQMDVSQVRDVVRPMMDWLHQQSMTEHATLLVGDNMRGIRLASAVSVKLQPNAAFIVVTLTSYTPAVNRKAKAAITAFAERHFSSANVFVKSLSDLSAHFGKLEYTLSGHDGALLWHDALALKAVLRSIPGTHSIENSWGNRTPFFAASVNRRSAKTLGISLADIHAAIHEGLQGQTVTEILQKNAAIPVVFQWPLRDRADITKVKQLMLYSPATRQAVPLSAVATFKLSYRFEQATTRDGVNAIVVSASNTQLPMSQVQSVVSEQFHANPQNHLHVGGEAHVNKMANKALLEYAVPCGIVLLGCLLYGLGSVRRVVVLLSVLPLAFIGAAWGLYITDTAFDYVGMIGLISLIGITINDGIILLDAVERGLQKKHTIRESILLAARSRLKPILLTTFTTIGGIIPLLLMGGETWRSLSIVFIFGESLSTFILLVVLPVMYSLLFRYWKPVNPIPAR